MFAVFHYTVLSPDECYHQSHSHFIAYRFLWWFHSFGLSLCIILFVTLSPSSIPHISLFIASLGSPCHWGLRCDSDWVSSFIQCLYLCICLYLVFFSFFDALRPLNDSLFFPLCLKLLFSFSLWDCDPIFISEWHFRCGKTLSMETMSLWRFFRKQNDCLMCL